MKKFAEKNTKDILLNANEFESSFAGQASTLSLTEAVIFIYNKENKSTKTLSKTAFSFFPTVEKLDFKANYNPNDLGYSLIFNEDDNYIRAMTAVDTMPNTYVIVGRLINDKVVRHIQNAQNAHSDYRNLKSGIAKTERQVIVVFTLIIMLIILAVVLLAINYSAKILLPIFDIVLATRQVSQGKYNISLNTKNTSDEISVLLKSFNRMAKLLGQKNSDLNLSNQIITTKKQFLETVLGNMPAATLVLNGKKHIKLFNKAAKQVFKDKSLTNADISIIFPEIAKLLDKLHGCPNSTVQDTIKVKQGSKQVVLHVFVTIEKSAGEVSGYILNILKAD